eukprot:gene1242-1728_t
MGAEIARQMTSEPKSWMIASVGMLAFAALPGMPTVTFIVISLMTGALGYYLAYERKKQEQQEGSDGDAIAPEQNGEEDLRSFDPSRPYLLQFPAALNGSRLAVELMQSIRQTRNGLVANLGLTLPPFEVEFSTVLAEDELRFCVHEVPVLRATLGPWLAVEYAALSEVPHDGVRGQVAREEEEWVWLATDHPLLTDEHLERVTAQNLILERME